MFLDLRYLPFLEEEDCTLAKQVLPKIWEAIEALNLNLTPTTESVRQETPEVEDEVGNN